MLVDCLCGVVPEFLCVTCMDKRGLGEEFFYSRVLHIDICYSHLTGCDFYCHIN